MMNDFDLEFKLKTLEAIQDNLASFHELVDCFLKGNGCEQTFKEMFRLTHNMKGNASAANFDSLASLFHSFESRLIELGSSFIFKDSASFELLEYCSKVFQQSTDATLKNIHVELNFDDVILFIEKFDLHKRSLYSFLLVDDEKDFIEILRDSLRTDFDCRITIASNGHEALNYCLQQPFDYILTDFNMPVLNGRDFLSSIRQDNQMNSLTPVIFMSGHQPDLIPVEKLWRNVFILDKPFSHQKLSFLIRCGLNLTKSA
jgi:two-component system, chemotaxis family, chemotaxis protein CheY